MNIEEIDKWLDNEYGCSYTKLEELHNYWFEKSTDQKLEIERLNNIINELEKDIKNLYTYGIKNNAEQRDYLLNRLEELKELKGDGSNDSKRDV